MSNTMPLFGFRQPQSAAAVCGQNQTPSIAPPACCTILCILLCISVSSCMVNRPRPMPDWLVATATV